MEISAEQERGIKAALNWFHYETDRKPYFFLEGPAGSGKSTVIMEFAKQIEGKVLFVAPTAGAALVMRRKGCPNPTTIHRLIYRPAGQTGDKEQIDLLRELRNDDIKEDRASYIKSKLIESFKAEIDKIQDRQKLAIAEEDKQKGSGRLDILRKALATNLSNYKDLVSSNPIFDLNHDSEIKTAKLVIVDEVSMVTSQTMTDLLSFGIPMLVQGDLNQLPPVKASGYFDSTKADFSLTQIHRQAQDSPIIYLATLARLGKPLPLGWHGNCLVTRSAEEGLPHALESDQVIVGKHTTRHLTTDKLRQLRGYTGILSVGERVICRHNDAKKGIYNGEQYKVTFFRDGVRECRVGIENEEFSGIVNAHRDYFLKKEPNPYTKSKAACLDHGAVITCHNSQGRQYSSVYVYDESEYFRPFNRNWLYVACSRPTDKLVVRLK